MKEYEDTPLHLPLLEAADFEQWPTGRLVQVVEQALIRRAAELDRLGARWHEVQRRAARALVKRKGADYLADQFTLGQQPKQ